MPDAVDAFVAAAKVGTKPMLGTGSQPSPRPSSGRLIFALDATASRQPTWDMATGITCEMLREAGGLEAQLRYFRGADEFRAFDWVSDSARLVRFMGSIRCQSGPTQIGKVLGLALTETERRKVGALVFVGDASSASMTIPSICAAWRALSARQGPRSSCSRKLTTPKSRASSATSHRSQAAHTRASSPAQRRS
jgi:hypothetical protein